MEDIIESFCHSSCSRMCLVLFDAVESFDWPDAANKLETTVDICSALARAVFGHQSTQKEIVSAHGKLSCPVLIDRLYGKSRAQAAKVSSVQKGHHEPSLCDIHRCHVDTEGVRL